MELCLIMKTPGDWQIWLVIQRPWFVLIQGTTKQGRSKENSDADQVTFTDGEMQKINRELDPIRIIVGAGTMYRKKAFWRKERSWNEENKQ